MSDKSSETKETAFLRGLTSNERVLGQNFFLGSWASPPAVFHLPVCDGEGRCKGADHPLSRTQMERGVPRHHSAVKQWSSPQHPHPAWTHRSGQKSLEELCKVKLIINPSLRILTNAVHKPVGAINMCQLDFLPYPTPPGRSAFCLLQLHSQPGRCISQHPQAVLVGSAGCALLKRNAQISKQMQLYYYIL